MNKIIIEKLDSKTFDNQVIIKIAELLSDEYPDEFKSLKKFFKDWFTDIIPGEKMTFVARIDEKLIGIVRFWKSPYLHDYWLIEGLEVLKPYRRMGVATKLLEAGSEEFTQITHENLYVHIMNYNTASQKIHQKLNFVKCSCDGRDSFGTKRKNLERYQYMK